MAKELVKKYNNIKEEEYYKKVLNLINFIQDNPKNALRQKEITVLAGFMSLPYNEYRFNRFGTKARKLVSRNLDISPAVINNIVSILNKKGVLFNDEDNIKSLAPKFENGILNQKEIKFIFHFNINKDNE